MRFRKTYIIVAVTLVVAFLLIRRSTKAPQQNSVGKSTDHSKQQKLFTKHCGSCHMLPHPQDITKDLWRSNVLPLMAIRMGIKDDTYERRLSEEEKEVEQNAGLIPEQPLISTEDFESIAAYIISLAPDTIPHDLQRLSRTKPLQQFLRQDVAIEGSKPSLITALKCDTTSGSLWIANFYNQVINWKWKDGILSGLEVSSPVVHFSFYKGNIFFTAIGDLLPSELSRGTLGYLNRGRALPVLSSLHRPVFAQIEDLNDDSTPEIIVSNFGKNLGGLSLFKGGNNSQPLTEQVLMSLPGATKTYIADMNADGRKDILALLAQGDESIYIFYNQGDLKFVPKRILRYPPHYGTSDFLLLDYNKDGRLDIVTAHGDNADYSIMLKPYHGIRISINEGNDVYQEEFFFPIYGVTRLLAEDFDQDGDVDFAANSFYPDYGQLVHESFVYLENNGTSNYNFQAYAHHASVPVKSLTMEKTDIDGDGDVDIILGNFAFSPVAAPAELERKWKSADYDLIVFLNSHYTRK